MGPVSNSGDAGGDDDPSQVGPDASHPTDAGPPAQDAGPPKKPAEGAAPKK